MKIFSFLLFVMIAFLQVVSVPSTDVFSCSPSFNIHLHLSCCFLLFSRRIVERLFFLQNDLVRSICDLNMLRFFFCCVAAPTIGNNKFLHDWSRAGTPETTHLKHCVPDLPSAGCDGWSGLAWNMFYLVVARHLISRVTRSYLSDIRCDCLCSILSDSPLLCFWRWHDEKLEAISQLAAGEKNWPERKCG